MIRIGPENAQAAFDGKHRDQEVAAPHRDPRQARRRRHQRRGPRRRLRDRPRLPPPRRPRRPRLAHRPARGHAGPAARRRRRHPHRTPHGHRRRAAQGAAPGHPVHPAAGPGERPGPRGRRHPRGDARQGQGLHRREPRVPAALGRQGLPDPRRHPVEPQVRRQPAGFPVQPEEAARRCADARAAQHPGRGRRGLAGRLRERAHHRGPLLHRAGHRPGLEEHDPGVLLRPPGRQLRRQPPEGHRGAPGPQGRGPRRRDDGRGHRVLLRPGRYRRRPQGRLHGGRRQGQGVQREAARQGALPWPYHRGEARRAARPHHPDR